MRIHQADTESEHVKTRRHGEQTGSCRRKEASGEPNPAETCILDFQPPKSGGTKLLLFKPPGLSYFGSLNKLIQMLWNFLHRQLCHQQIGKIEMIFISSFLIFITYLTLLKWLKFPALCWRRLLRVDIPMVFPIFEGKHLILHCTVLICYVLDIFYMKHVNSLWSNLYLKFLM